MPSRRQKLTDQPEIPGLSLEQSSSGIVAGVDEVGRGCLFGPVVAAAVILPDSALADLTLAGVTDSKQLSALQRQHLATQIKALAVDCRIGYASVREIDRLNILQASLLAMKRAVLRLKVQPDLCLIDGNQRIPGLAVPQQTLVKGDQTSLAIAAASIIAKVWRDELISRLAVRYPQYDLASNKGYGTHAHRRALQQFGPSPYHRTSFGPCRCIPTAQLTGGKGEGVKE
ncbi:MAG: ribonuclease HII [Leptodesmis sp.]|uniref:ribonuclease HII n=1 Tax=Leptodesmis sp. TaxID=3100501 RepID=UPI003D114592